MRQESRFLIIGAGIAGLTAATTIRALFGKSAQISLINNEPYAPYKRTNLSKFLASGFQPEDFTLASEQDLQQFYKIELVYDTITRIDYQKNQAFGQKQYDYDILILATGARYDVPKSLLNERVKYYHNKEETFALMEALPMAQKIAILGGGGVQGLETCYQLLQLGKQVCVIDPSPLPLAHFGSPYISKWLQEDLQKKNVDCLWNTCISEFSNSILEDFDLSICCFGTKPTVALFPENIVVQEDLLLAGHIPNALACGDNVVYPDGKRCTLWHEAMDMGQLAGQNAVALARGVDQLARLQRKPYRCKIEIADRILFLAPPLRGNGDSEKDFMYQDFMHQGSYYQFFLDEREQLLGASLLCDDRDLLQPLQQVLWDSLPYGEARKQLGID